MSIKGLALTIIEYGLINMRIVYITLAVTLSVAVGCTGQFRINQTGELK